MISSLPFLFNLDKGPIIESSQFHLNSGQNGTVVLIAFFSIGAVVWFFYSLFKYFHGGADYPWKNAVDQFSRETTKKNMKIKALKKGTEDRKDYFRLYELLKDADFRKEYLNVYKSKEDLFAERMLER